MPLEGSEQGGGWRGLRPWRELGCEVRSGPVGHAKALALHLSEVGATGVLRAEECTVGLTFPCLE